MQILSKPATRCRLRSPPVATPAHHYPPTATATTTNEEKEEWGHPGLAGCQSTLDGPTLVEARILVHM